jgi:thiamine biosynthesis lipoprotein
MSELARACWSRWGGDVVVLVDDPASLPRARSEVQRVLDEFDIACSRFRDDSELARVNAAGGRPVIVSPLFMDVLDAAMRAAQLSQGAVDPTVGEALVVAGYDRDFDLIGSRTQDLRSRPAVHFARVAGFEVVTVNRRRRSVSVPAGVRLDLGACAKALAADRGAAAVHAATGAGSLVSLAGDLAVAGAAPPEGWRVRVAEDHRAAEDAPGQTISIFDGGVATSSTTVRRWSDDGEQRHHIIDPASGRPADVVWRTVSVAAASCLDANTAATAAIVLGAGAVSWLHETGLPARLVSATGDTLAIEGWPVEAMV